MLFPRTLAEALLLSPLLLAQWHRAHTGSLDSIHMMKWKLSSAPLTSLQLDQG